MQSKSSPGTDFRVVLLDTKNQNPNHYICLAIEQALMLMPEVKCVVKAELDNVVSEAIKYKCNLFLAFDGEQLERSICSRVVAICNLSVLWVTEDPYELNTNIANSDLFDLVFTNDSNCVKAYGKKGRHLPLAGAKSFHFLPIQEQSERLRYDLFFAGTAWPNRVKLLKSVFESAKINPIKTKIFLPTNEHLPALDLALPSSQLNWRTSPLDFARFANTSVATLVLPRVFSASNNHDFAETPPPRLYEAALAGTAQLVQSNLTEAEQYFESGQDFLYFDTSDDLVKLTNDLRSNSVWRNKIAYNAQNKALKLHCYENRVSNIITELDILLQTRRSKPGQQLLKLTSKQNILFVVHNIIEYGNYGGVEVYVKNISRGLNRDYNVLFYVPEDASSVNVINIDGVVLKKIQFKSLYSYSKLSCSEREESFSLILREFEISLVHFHHLINHVPSLVEIAKAFGVATVMTLQDYFSICHNFTLLSFDRTYCHPDKISTLQCDVCLHNGPDKILHNSQSVRRAYWDYILTKIDTVIFNTQGCYELTAKIYPAIAKHKSVTILPLPILPIKTINSKNNSNFNPIKVAVFGNFSYHKGADVISRIIPFFDNSNVEFHIFGRKDGYQWIDTNSRPFVHFYGHYEQGALPREIDSCHISLHVSIWPETYCLTLSEAWERGLVPIVSDIGALGERVIDGINGLKIQPNSESEIIKAIRALSETPELLQKLQYNIKNKCISVQYLDTHIIELCNVYRGAIAVERHITLDRQENEVELKLNLSKLRCFVIPNWAKKNPNNPPQKSNFTKKSFVSRSFKKFKKLTFSIFKKLFMVFSV